MFAISGSGPVLGTESTLPKQQKVWTHQDEPKDSDLQRWGLFVQTSTVCCRRIWGEDLDGVWRLYRGTKDRRGSYSNKSLPKLQEPVLKISPLQKVFKAPTSVTIHLRDSPQVITWSHKNWLGFCCQSPTREMIGHFLSLATAGVEAPFVYWQPLVRLRVDLLCLFE